MFTFIPRMERQFYKYHGAGNDFILFDNCQKPPQSFSQAQIASWCRRRFGIGADGFISIEKSQTADFYMRYCNADGNVSTMCGNGGRCAVAFAHRIGLIDTDCTFEAADGLHQASLGSEGLVKLGMQDVKSVTQTSTHCFVDSGSPHHVLFQKNINSLDVALLGREIRYGAPYFETGANVNFVEHEDENRFLIRTYERGVEAETLACGTGAVAAALSAYTLGHTNSKTVEIDTKGGRLTVSFEPQNEGFENITLKGPTAFVFQMTLNINE